MFDHRTTAAMARGHQVRLELPGEAGNHFLVFHLKMQSVIKIGKVMILKCRDNVFFDGFGSPIDF